MAGDAREFSGSEQKRVAPSFRLTVFGLIAALTLASLDANIIGTALPIIASDLGGLASLSWVVTAFLLAQSATLLVYGKLSDMYGRRPLFLAAVVIFVTGSVLCGLSQAMLQLILSRALQGVGAAGILTLSSSTIADLVSPRERGRYQGLFTGTYAICSVAGPLVGGGLTSWFGWRSVFLINLPLGLIVLVLLAKTLPTSERRESHDIDYAGAALIMATTVTGMLALSWGGAVMPWTSPAMLLLIAVSALSLVGLILREQRAREPILDLTLFRNRVFTTTQIANALAGLPFFGGLIFLPLYLQLVRGFDPASAGLILVPQLTGLLVASLAGGAIVSRTGRYKPFITAGFVTNGICLTAIGTILIYAGPLPLLMLALFALGTGGGMCMPNITIAVQSAVARPQLGAATAFTSFAGSLAGSAGIALSGAIITGKVHAFIASRAAAGDVERIVHAGVTDAAQLSAGNRTILLDAYTHSIAMAFLIGGAMFTLAVIASLFIPNKELRTDLQD